MNRPLTVECHVVGNIRRVAVDLYLKNRGKSINEKMWIEAENRGERFPKITTGVIQKKLHCPEEHDRHKTEYLKIESFACTKIGRFKMFEISYISSVFILFAL